MVNRAERRERAVRALVLGLLIAGAAGILSFRSVYEPDLGWHLAHGRETLSGNIVRSNIFSFTYPDYRQHYTSWLFEASAYAGWRIAGDAGVQVLEALLIAGALSLTYAACRRRGAILPSLSVLALGFLVIEPRAIPRPHLVSFVGLAACAWLIERALVVRSSRPLVWAIPLVALWANFHSECVFGVLAIGLFGAAEFVRPGSLTRHEALRVMGIAAVCGAATLATPYGWGLIRYLFENSELPRLLSIAELRPAYLPSYGAFFVYAALAAALLVLSRARTTLWEVLAVIVFAALGWRFLRLTPLVFFMTAPILAARLTAWTTRGVDGRAILITTIAACIFLSRVPLSGYVTGLQAGALFPRLDFPPSAIAFVEKHGLEGPVFNSNNLGGWIAWTLYPRARTFQDSRLQAYPPEHFRRILASRSAAEWDALTAAVDWAIVSTARPNALSGTDRFPTATWATIFWDEAVRIDARRAGRYSALADALEYEILTPDAELFELVPQLTSADGDRLRAEARRNRAENPEGFLAAAVLCLAGDPRDCDAAERLGSRWPTLNDDLALLRALAPNRR